jgi:hypothetical protein
MQYEHVVSLAKSDIRGGGYNSHSCPLLERLACHGTRSVGPIPGYRRAVTKWRDIESECGSRRHRLNGFRPCHWLSYSDGFGFGNGTRDNAF